MNVGMAIICNVKKCYLGAEENQKVSHSLSRD